MKVEEYNCLTADTACVPNYTPNPRHRCIQAYYALNNDVILIESPGRDSKCCAPIWLRSISFYVDFVFSAMVIPPDGCYYVYIYYKPSLMVSTAIEIISLTYGLPVL